LSLLRRQLAQNFHRDVSFPRIDHLGRINLSRQDRHQKSAQTVVGAVEMGRRRVRDVTEANVATNLVRVEFEMRREVIAAHPRTIVGTERSHLTHLAATEMLGRAVALGLVRPEKSVTVTEIDTEAGNEASEASDQITPSAPSAVNVNHAKAAEETPPAKRLQPSISHRVHRRPACRHEMTCYPIAGLAARLAAAHPAGKAEASRLHPRLPWIRAMVIWGVVAEVIGEAMTAAREVKAVVEEREREDDRGARSWGRHQKGSELGVASKMGTRSGAYSEKVDAQ
jgi:hypothetical protein